VWERRRQRRGPYRARTSIAVSAPANAPQPPPLPPSAAADRAAAGLTAAAPLCNSDEVPRAVAHFNRKGRPAGLGKGVVSTSLSASPPSAPYDQGTCPRYYTDPSNWYCHEIEQEDYVNEVGIFAPMGEYAAATAPGDPYAHSISQLWGVANNGNSTLETGWSVAPAHWGCASPVCSA
jgi:hypothetical protein